MEVAVTAIIITIIAAAAVVVAIEKSDEIMEMIARVVGMNEIEQVVIVIEIEAVIDGLRQTEDLAKIKILNPLAAAVVVIENIDVILPNIQKMKLCH
ncbi:hypothetical protein G6F42_018787 [Rhizopus arrhizus]|nr:hypothetical protein G6F42_018787 [Rhizopus arrhizus]